MENEKSEGAESKIDEMQSEDGVPERQDSPDPQFNGGMLGAAVDGVEPQPEVGTALGSQVFSPCSDCPEEMAEEVYLGRVQGEAALMFHVHLKTCRPCHRVYEETVRFVDATRAAAETLASVDGFTVN